MPIVQHHRRHPTPFPIAQPGLAPDNRLETDFKLRVARRDLKIAQKQWFEAQRFSEDLSVRAIGLMSEAQQVGILSREPVQTTPKEALETLTSITEWKPAAVPEEDMRRIAGLEDEIAAIRKERAAASETLRATRLFAEKEDGFTNEAQEQKSRLESIRALPKHPETGEWQWPFAPANLGLDTPIGKSLLRELESLDRELDAVGGERPHLEEYTQKLQTQIEEINQKLRSKDEALAAAIAANAAIAEMGNRNAAAARIVGRVSLFMETYRTDDDLARLKQRVDDMQSRIVSCVTPRRLALPSGAIGQRPHYDCRIAIKKLSLFAANRPFWRLELFTRHSRVKDAATKHKPIRELERACAGRRRACVAGRGFWDG